MSSAKMFQSFMQFNQQIFPIDFPKNFSEQPFRFRERIATISPLYDQEFNFDLGAGALFEVSSFSDTFSSQTYLNHSIVTRFLV